jgi:hypothetical protein
VEGLNIPFISVITELDYVQRESGVDVLTTTETGPEIVDKKTLYSRLDYLSVPVLAIATLTGTIISPYIVAGPRFDFLFDYKSDKNAFNDL